VSSERLECFGNAPPSDPLSEPDPIARDTAFSARLSLFPSGNFRLRATKSERCLANHSALAAPVGSSWLWTYGFDPAERQSAQRLLRDARGGDGGVREKLAAGIAPVVRDTGQEREAQSFQKSLNRSGDRSV